MNDALRPMTLGEILDRTFQIYRARFRDFVAIAAMPAALLTGLQLADAYWWHLRTRFWPQTSNSAGLVFWNVVMALALYHVAIVVRSVFVPALLKRSSDCALGEAGSLMSALRFAGERWGRFLWIGMLLLLFVLIGSELFAAALFVGVVGILGATGFLSADRNLAVALGVILPSLSGFAFFLWMVGWTAFTAPACAFEDLRSLRAFGRSWRLSRGSRWRIAVTWILVLIVTVVLTWGIGWLVRWAYVLLWHWVSHRHLLTIAYTSCAWVMHAVISAVVAPVYPIALTLFYYDQRIRKEGFDIERMMQGAGMTAEAAQLPQEAVTASEPAVEAAVRAEHSGEPA